MRVRDFIVPQMSPRSAPHPPVEGADRFQQQKDYSICSQTVTCTKTQSFNTRLLRPPVARETYQVCACARLFARALTLHATGSICVRVILLMEPRMVSLRALFSCTCCPGLLMPSCGRQKSALIPSLCKNYKYAREYFTDEC